MLSKILSCISQKWRALSPSVGEIAEVGKNAFCIIDFHCSAKFVVVMISLPRRLGRISPVRRLVLNHTSILQPVTLIQHKQAIDTCQYERSYFAASSAKKLARSRVALRVHPNSNVSNPQSITPPRRIDQSEGFSENSMPSLTTYASIADTRY